MAILATTLADYPDNEGDPVPTDPEELYIRVHEITYLRLQQDEVMVAFRGYNDRESAISDPLKYRWERGLVFVNANRVNPLWPLAYDLLKSTGGLEDVTDVFEEGQP